MSGSRTSPILIVGSARDCPDLEYASGFRAADPVVFLKSSAGQALVVPALEHGRAGRSSGAGGPVEAHTPEGLGLKGLQRRKLEHWALALLQRAGIRLVTVPASFPLAVARRLEKNGIRVQIARKPLFPERAVKTPEEVSRIRQAQQAAVIAMRTAVAEIASAEPDRRGVLTVKGRPLSSESIRRVIARALLDHDCSGKETIVAAGAQSADPHERGAGPLRAGEPIVIDIFPQHASHGYWGDLTRTVLRGRAAPEFRNMYRAVKAAHGAALARVKPGVNTADVHGAAMRALEQRGYKTGIVDGKPTGFIHSTGHGVGLAIHEAPSVGPGSGTLEAGNVITIEPGFYRPGEGGVRIEDTVVVTESGWRYLVPCEKRFEL